MTMANTQDTQWDSEEAELVECPAGISPELWEKWQAEARMETFMGTVNAGMRGNNVGLDNTLYTMNKYLHGTHRGRYYLLGADSGVGKTTIADYMFVLTAWYSARQKGKKLKIVYASYEIPKITKEAKWVAFMVWLKFKVRLPMDYILGYIDGKRLSKEHYRMVAVGYSMVSDLMSDIVFIEHMLTPTQFFSGVVKVYEKYGTVHRLPVSEEDKARGVKEGMITGYTFNKMYEDLYMMVITDHVALSMEEPGKTTKQTIDMHSRYGVVLRNLFGATIVNIQQFSTDLMAANRSKQINGKTQTDLTPNRLDFGDSKATFRDADVVLGFIAPGRDMSTYRGYHVDVENGLGLFMIASFIMKHRFGIANKEIPLFMDPVTGHIHCLPTNPLEGEQHLQKWIEIARQIEQSCQ